MKSAIILTVAFAAFLFTACSNDGSSKKAGDASTDAPGLNPGAATTATTGAVMHYICPKNCAGSGGDGAGTCPVCGSEYVHNDAFHNQPATPALTPPSGGPFDNQAAPSITPPAPAVTEPAQNAAGVFHYTCTKGCAGGAGAAGSCSKCGAELAHNAAYHQ
jgi:hypothetical protein